MNSLQAGLAEAPAAVMALAEALLAGFPVPAHFLVGITLAQPGTGRRVPLDLVVVTAAAAVVGVDANRPAAEHAGPRLAGQLLLQLQHEAGLAPLLPVYVLWLGDAPPPGAADDAPALASAEHVQHYILRAGGVGAVDAAGVPAELVELIVKADVGPDGGARPTPPLRRAARVLRHLPEQLDPVKFVRRGGPLRPADITKQLELAMLDRRNHLEDANYGKIVPNDYVVEVSRENYERHYQPIEERVVEQWQQRLLDSLNTANGRQGFKAYRFGGPVQVSIRAADGLAAGEVRIYAQIQPESPAPQASACLIQLPERRPWPLAEGVTLIGRSRHCDIQLEAPAIQERRLVSGEHAHIRCQGGACRLYDGSPAGKPSLNGTFVNGRPVPAEGQALRDGDAIVLAALDPARPDPQTPGAAAFTFEATCS